MPKSDPCTLKSTVFGDQFDHLADALVDPDPVERAKALWLLSTYLDDCMKPLIELKKEVEWSLAKADRFNRASARQKAGVASSAAPTSATSETSRKKMSAREAQIACIEAMVAQP